MMRWMRLLALAGVLAGCSSATPPPPVPPVASACPADPVLETAGPPRRQAVGAEATAMFFSDTVVRGAEVKIVWSMPGSGDFAIRAVGATTVEPVWGPDVHLDPPDEWGTGWVFPSPGCWTFEARRGADTARVTIRVAASPNR
ncbi:hypothetical protein [Cryptosporangium sp. NPDC048952]|uniref:hypothetical protein n=1 Tax=Cryptosporangium sp. NPDC048952 TaxID=3363961 RepID=UPI003721444E